jgi:hypothetical protein
MSKYLDEKFGTEYLIGNDRRVMGELCLKYRPDKIYASPDIVLHIECDENQHAKISDYSCDEKRISEIYGEFPGKKYVVIRWNPDNYKNPIDIRKITKKSEKLEILLKCIKEVIKNPPEELIKIYYLFYDIDNPIISKNLPYCLIYK